MSDISDADLKALEEEFSKTLKFEKYGKFGTLLFTIIMVDAQPRIAGPLTTHPRFPDLQRRLPANHATANIDIDWDKLEPVNCKNDGGLYHRLSIQEKINFIRFGISVWEKSGKPENGQTFEHFAVGNTEDSSNYNEDSPKIEHQLQAGNCCIFFGTFGSVPPGCAPC